MFSGLDRREFVRRCLLGALGAGLGRAAAQPHPSPVDRRANSFGPRATAEEVTRGLDLKGLTALVTGCNSGIGQETMRVLALRGAHVLGTARTRRKARDACRGVVGTATPLVLELSSFESAAACAEDVLAKVPALDVLILNAGVLLPELERVNGLEKHFVVNHLGHFVLVNRLLGALLAARAARVVVVSSVSHWSAPPEGIDFDGLAGDPRTYDAAVAYGQSKLANGLLAYELARRLADTHVTANAVHPGVVDTNLFRHSWATISGGRGRKTVEQGAATSCYVATHPDLAGVTGRYFEDCRPAEPSDAMRDPALAARLWSVSEALTRPYLEPAAAAAGPRA